MPQFQAGTGIPLRPNEASKDSKDSPLELSAVRIRNRRRKYLESHPEYLNNPELELSGLFCLSSPSKL